MKINISKNYKIFKFADFNRDINRGNLKKLIELNRDKSNFKSFPILVDKDFVIIDGQHRFEACKELGYPIYYIVSDEKASPEFIHTLNIAGKKHTIADQIEILAKSGNTGAQRIIELDITTKLSSSSILECLYMKSHQESKAMLLRHEAFNKTGLSIIYALCDLPLRNISNRLARAFTRVVKDLSIEPEYLAKRIVTNWHLFRDAGREKDVYNNIVTTYNHRLRNENKISIVI